MEILLVVLAYLCQIALTIVVAMVLPVCLWYGMEKYSKKRRMFSFFIGTFICISLEVSAMLYLAYNPVVICPKELQPHFSQQMEELVVMHNKGIYSWSIPTLPLVIQVLEADPNTQTVVVKTHYIFWKHKNGN